MRQLLSDTLFRIRALFDRRAQRELDEELRFHLDMDAAALRSRGLAPAEAERVARRQFGSMRREAERVRDAWGITIIFWYNSAVWQPDHRILAETCVSYRTPNRI